MDQKSLGWFPMIRQKVVEHIKIFKFFYSSFSLLLLFCLILRFSLLREGIIIFTEGVLLRPLNRMIWDSILLNISGIGFIIILIIFFVLMLFLFLYRYYHKICLIFLNYIWIIPIIYSIAVISIYSVDILYWDDWSTISIYDHFKQNGFLNISTIKIFFSQHNEHRLFFPMIIMMLIRTLSRFNLKIDVFVIQLMTIILYITCIKYFNYIGKDFKYNKQIIIKALMVFLCGIAFFSFVQYENFLWSFQVAFYMAIFGSILSLYCLQKYFINEEIKYCLFSIIFGLIASFSSLHGILIWLIIYILLIIYYFVYKINILSISILYILAGIFSFIIYFFGWKHPVHHPELNTNIILLFKYIITCVGGMYTSTFSALSIIALLSGLLTLFAGIYLILYCIVKKYILKVIFPIGIFGYGLASILTVAIGRAGFGIGQALSSRYASFAVLIFIGIIMITYNVVNLKNIKYKCIIKYFVIILSVLIISGNFIGLIQAKRHSNFLSENYQILLDYENQPLDNLKRLFPWDNYEQAYERIIILKENKISVFR